MEDQAQRYLDKAVQCYQKGDTSGAVKALGQALDLNPVLGYDALAGKLAARLTGLETREALKVMRNVEKRGAFIRKRSRQSQQRGPSKLGIRIGIIIVVASILSAIATFANQRPDITNGLLSSTGQIEHYTLTIDDTPREYYVITPNGEPPENGWPTLIAIHGDGQTGADMASAFQETAQTNGVLVIAPTLTEIHADATENEYATARRLLLVLLDEAQMLVFNNPRLYLSYQGQSYFGSGQGAAFVSWLAGQGLDYADAGFAINMPVGVVLANGEPDFFAPSTLSQNIPYLITVGEDHPQAELSETYAHELQDRGITVGLQVIPGSQNLSIEQVTLAVNFTREIFTGS